MTNFNFLKSLNEQLDQGSTVSKKKLTEGIEYEEYDVILFNDSVKTVYIPLKRTDLFESELQNAELLTEVTVRGILRKCNGVTEI